MQTFDTKARVPLVSYLGPGSSLGQLISRVETSTLPYPVKLLVHRLNPLSIHDRLVFVLKSPTFDEPCGERELQPQSPSWLAAEPSYCDAAVHSNIRQW